MVHIQQMRAYGFSITEKIESNIMYIQQKVLYTSVCMRVLFVYDVLKLVYRTSKAELQNTSYIYGLSTQRGTILSSILWLSVIPVKSAMITVAISKDNVYIVMYFYIHIQSMTYDMYTETVDSDCSLIVRYLFKILINSSRVGGLSGNTTHVVFVSS